MPDMAHRGSNVDIWSVSFVYFECGRHFFSGHPYVYGVLPYAMMKTAGQAFPWDHFQGAPEDRLHKGK